MPPRGSGFQAKEKDSYIHGGAWRDPCRTSSDFDAVEALLLSSGAHAHRIAAFASINYRLSRHPDYPQPDRPDQVRNAKHPDHLDDVKAALALLQHTYGFGQRYVLVGHSCGATLAFQAVTPTAVVDDDDDDSDASPAASNTDALTLAHPAAILGVAGIYDLRLLRDRFAQYTSAYQEFLEGAFGPDETVWDAVSPARAAAAAFRGSLVVLAYSRDDELVDQGQVEAMHAMLRLRWLGSTSTSSTTTSSSDGKRRVAVLVVNGRHDEIWSQGQELARAVEYTFAQLLDLGRISDT